MTKLFRTLSALLFPLALLSACLPQTAAPVPAPASTLASQAPASPAASASPLPLSSPENDASLPSTPLPKTQLPTADSASPDSHSPLSSSPFPLSIPVSLASAADPRTFAIDPSYRFASTQNGQREPHHGVEFLVPFGSPVLAAADGTVIFAGNDNNGSPYTPPNNYAFYGNFIILEHPITHHQSPITNFYTLYAHLSEIHVQPGDLVRAGDEIGLVGFTGAALGPHLHFEVRLGGLTYADAHNPELFLDQPGRGVLAGRILDAGVAGSPGLPIPPTALTLTSLTPDPGAPDTLYLTTYEDPALALRPPYHENFALALPPGQYELAFVLYGIHKHVVEIQPGELTFFEITVGNE